MRDIWSQLKPWLAAGEPFAIATVTRTSRSSPRGVGACLAVSADGQRFLGSVSAGCVEVEVIEAAKLTVADGRARRLEFGPDQGFPWEVGLSCGGKIAVRIDRYPAFDAAGSGRQVAEALAAALDGDERAVLVCGEGCHALIREAGAAGLEAFPEEVAKAAQERFRSGGDSGELAVGETVYFLNKLDARPLLFVIGASHIAIHLAMISRSLAWETILVDPRGDYAREERFLTVPDRLIVDWPERVLPAFGLSRRDSLVALTHDPKIDDQALAAALRSGCGYVGALGSRRSHEARLKRLGALGLAAGDLRRIHGPVGLDIGSKTPAEIAVSIAAQIIQLRSGQGPEPK